MNVKSEMAPFSEQILNDLLQLTEKIFPEADPEILNDRIDGKYNVHAVIAYEKGDFRL